MSEKPNADTRRMIVWSLRHLRSLKHHRGPYADRTRQDLQTSVAQLRNAERQFKALEIELFGRRVV